MEIENIDVGESYKEMINLMEDISLEVNDNKKEENDNIKSDETIAKKISENGNIKKNINQNDKHDVLLNEEDDLTSDLINSYYLL